MKTIKILFFILCGIILISADKKTSIPHLYKPKNAPAVSLSHKKIKKIVYILPLGNVKGMYVNEVKKSIIDFYGFDCMVLSNVPVTNDIISKSRTRLDADKILCKYFFKFNCIVITELDIACKNEDRNIDEWGIFGLGYCPGNTCVVSTFRLKRNVGEDVLINRLKKVSLHEIGHNLGLDHCKNNPYCIMNDANGTISQVDREKIFLCDKCKKIISVYL